MATLAASLLGCAAAECAPLDFRAGALSRAHFGLYAPPLLRAGELLNGDLESLELRP